MILARASLSAWREDVFEVTGRNRLLDIALELERIALEDEYFISRKLYPNVDFYSGIIYQAMGLPVAMFPVMFAIPRTVGWLAQWQEMITDPEQKIARPRQVFVGQAAPRFSKKCVIGVRNFRQNIMSSGIRGIFRLEHHRSDIRVQVIWQIIGSEILATSRCDNRDSYGY